MLRQQQDLNRKRVEKRRTTGQGLCAAAAAATVAIIRYAGRPCMSVDTQCVRTADTCSN